MYQELRYSQSSWSRGLKAPRSVAAVSNRPAQLPAKITLENLDIQYLCNVTLTPRNATVSVAQNNPSEAADSQRSVLTSKLPNAIQARHPHTTLADRALHRPIPISKILCRIGIIGVSGSFSLSIYSKRARNHNLYVQVVLDGWPWTTYYRDIALADLRDIEGNNRENMTPGSIAAKTDYLERVVQAVKNAGLATTIFSYEISNEPCSWTNAKPFSVTTGIFKTAAGTYDMSSAASRQACADDNLVLALSTWRDAVKRIDPDTLVNVGLFSYAAVKKAGMATNGLLPIGTKDVRWPGRMKNVVSVTDFGDLHMYVQSTGTTVAQHMESQEWSMIQNKNTKPFISGEFGAHRISYPDDATAAAALYDWRQDMLDTGFAGALLFTWDTLNHSRWTAVEGNGAVNKALKPCG